MTGSEKYTWGIILSIGGSLGLFGGLALTATLIGACIGIPMALVGLPAMILGAVWTYQGHFQKQQEVITAGIRDGIAYMHGASTAPAAPAPMASMIPALAAPMVAVPSVPLVPETIEHYDGAGDPVDDSQPPAEAAEERQADDRADEGAAPTDSSALPS